MENSREKHDSDLFKNSPFAITDKIKHTCEYVHKNSTHVKINLKKIEEFVASKNDLFDDVPSWTSCHFNPNDFDLETSLAFTFVIDSLNFCFWPYEELNSLKNEPEFEYGNLVKNLIKTLKEDPSFFTSERLSNVTEGELAKYVFFNLIEFPLIFERTRSLNELGHFIKNKYNSSFFNFLKSNEYDCLKIASNITEGVTTFRDETIYKGKQIFIYKRAQILTADLFYMLRELHKPINLKNAAELTMFADYRVPQVLIELGILEYDEKLMNKIINKEEILSNTYEEIEIRANTIISVELIKKAIKEAMNKNIFSLEVDFILWNVGEEKRKSLKPHHRTLTIFY